MPPHTREPTIAALSKEFVQPDGYPDTTTINQRVGAAVTKLTMRGIVPQPNPLVTSWQIHALLKVLVRRGVFEQKDLDEFAYFTSFIQMQDLERLLDQKPTTSILVPTTAPPKSKLLA